MCRFSWCRLRTLHIDNNELRDVEDDIGRLTALELLNLNNNQVRLDRPCHSAVLASPSRSDTSPVPGILPLDVFENVECRGECRDNFSFSALQVRNTCAALLLRPLRR